MLTRLSDKWLICIVVLCDAGCIVCVSSMPSNHKGFEHADHVYTSMDVISAAVLHVAVSHSGLNPNDMRPRVSRAWSKSCIEGTRDAHASVEEEW